MKDIISEAEKLEALGNGAKKKPTDLQENIGKHSRPGARILRNKFPKHFPNSLAESLAVATAAGVLFKLCRLAASCLALVAFGSRPPALHWVPPWERSSMQTFAWALGASTALLCCRIVALPRTSFVVIYYSGSDCSGQCLLHLPSIMS